MYRLSAGELRLGHGERDVDRRELVDDDERRRVVGANQIALVHHQGAGAPRHRRGDRRVLQLNARVLAGPRDRQLIVPFERV